MMSPAAAIVLISLMEFCGCIAVACVIGTEVPYSSRWWKVARHSIGIGAVIGLVVASLSFWWLSRYY